MRRRVATVLVVPKTLHREGLARLLAKTSYKLIKSINSIDELADGPPLEGERALFIVGWDGRARGAGQDGPLREVRLVKEFYPQARLVVLSDVFNVDDVVATLRAGANGYIMNTMTSDALIKSLDLVMFGETVLASEFSRAVHDRASPILELAPPAAGPDGAHGPESADRSQRRGEASPETRKLSTRETAILARLMQGDSNKNIARGIGVAEATVKTHIKAILRKIQVKNRTQAALWAFTNLQGPLEPTSKAGVANGSLKRE